MKKVNLLLIVVFLASCAAPKYSYYFDHYNYNAGRKQSLPSKETSVLVVDPQALTASVTTQPELSPVPSTEPVVVVKKTYMQMNKTERKTLRHDLKKEVKTYIAAKKNSIQAAQAGGMDNDLKLAIIFGAVGIVGLIIGGDVFLIIGGIAMLIGVVFFVKWIIRQ